MLRALLVIFAACVIGACGNKGPLYMPDSKPPPKQAAKPAATPPSPATDEKK